MRDFAAWLAFLEARRRTPFAWGRAANDCVSFAGGSVKALTGRDLLAQLPDWTDEASAIAALTAQGGLEAAVGGQLGPIALSLAQRGDVGLVAGPRGPLLVIVEGAQLVGPGPLGLARLERRHLARAWSAT